MHVKYEASISYGLKVTAKVKGIFCNREIDSQRGQKRDAEFHTGGIKTTVGSHFKFILEFDVRKWRKNMECNIIERQLTLKVW